jgi:hypothetical protein
MYTLFDSPASATRLGCWSRPLGRYSEVIGYSHLGSLFLKDPAKSEYVVLHPLLHGNNAKAYGSFSSTKAFEDAVLKDSGFVARFLRPDDLRSLRERLGELSPNDVYYPVPFPCVGGSGALSTFEKGDVWVFADVLGQILGVH